MLRRFFHRLIALAALAISVLWALTYSRHYRGGFDSAAWEVVLILSAGVLTAVWVLLFARDSAPWVAAGRTLGFKSIYSERLPRPPFKLPEQISDLLGRTGPEFDIYLAHRCQQHLTIASPRTSFSGRDRDWDNPPLLDRADESLTAPYPVETFALISSRGLLLPRFGLEPEGIVDKLLDRPDVDFESHPEFSRRYRLWGMSELTLRTLFRPALLDFFSERPGWSLEAQGGWLLLCRKDSLVSAEELPVFVRDVLELHAALADACT
ncbi:MAG TPA: hypothetical protein VMB21_02555 [Candidatus Limnocylindria bacterium]|jgi:hypothetical protein|nr:hypothetical protein [Candidatus Limnocylindria bacterium]